MVLDNWNPLNLPRGSVRALITLTLLSSLWTLMLLGRELPILLCYLVLVALSHYFGSRTTSADEKSPLFLPRGSVRVIVIVGFAIVAYFLSTQGALDPDFHDRAALMLFLCFALLLGVLVRKVFDIITRGKANALRRGFENTKSIVVIALTGFLAFVWLTDTTSRVEDYALLASPLVVFYFGSRN